MKIHWNWIKVCTRCSLVLLVIAAIGVHSNSCAGTNVSQTIRASATSSATASFSCFKMELDSNNIDGALRCMAHPSGRPLMAIERRDISEDVARYQRLFAGTSITKLTESVQSESQRELRVEFDYIKRVTVSTQRISGEWFIVGIKE